MTALNCDLNKAVIKAAKHGANGIQVYASRGETAPENLSHEKRREFSKLVKITDFAEIAKTKQSEGLR